MVYRRTNTGIGLVDYSRQRDMDNSMRDIQRDLHVIIGCGGVGFWLGVLLAMIGIKQFVLFDGDVIQPSNLNRLPVPQTWLGKNKAIALRTIMRMMRPDVRSIVMKVNIDESSLSILSEFATKAGTRRLLIWDTTDDAKIQRKIYDKTKEMTKLDTRVSYNKIGYEAFKVGSYKEYNVWHNDDYERGYQTTMANAITSVLSAGLGIFNEALPNEEEGHNCEIDILKLIQRGGKQYDKKEEKRSRKGEGVGVGL